MKTTYFNKQNIPSVTVSYLFKKKIKIYPTKIEDSRPMTKLINLVMDRSIPIYNKQL